MGEEDTTDYSGYGYLTSPELMDLAGGGDGNFDWSGYGDLTSAELSELANSGGAVDWSGYANLSPSELANLYSTDSIFKKGIDFAKKIFGGNGSTSEYATLASLLGGLMAANKGSGEKILNPGYTGGIPEVKATRTMLNAPPAGRRPGSGGINYGGDVTYTRTGSNLTPQNIGQATPASMPLGGAGAPSSAGGSAAQQPDISSLVALLQQLGVSVPNQGGSAAPAPAPSTGAGDSGFVAGPTGNYGGFSTKAEYDKAVADKAAADAAQRAKVDAYQINANSMASLIPLMQDPTKIPRMANESVEDALRRIKAQDMEYSERMQRRQALANQGGNGIVSVTGTGYPEARTAATTEASIMGTIGGGPNGADPNDPWYLANQDKGWEYKNLLGTKAWVNTKPAEPTSAWEAATADQRRDALRTAGVIDGTPKILDQNTPGVQDVAAKFNAANTQPVPAKDLAAYEASRQPVVPASVAQAVQVAQAAAQEPRLPASLLPYAQEMKAGGLARDGFVIPADVVSHLGNGSSEAGLELLAEELGAKPIKGDGDGMSDSIPTTIDGKQPARVANEEAFVSPEMVKRLGNGDTDRGAQKLYAMMDRVRKARTGSKEQGKQINPEKFMPGGKVNYADGGITSVSGGQSLADWVGPYVADMLGKGKALSESPYQAYLGPLTAGASPLQEQAFGAASALRTPEAIGMGAGLAGTIGSSIGGMGYTPVGQSITGAPLAQPMGLPAAAPTMMSAYGFKGAAPLPPGLSFTGGTPNFDESTGQYINVGGNTSKLPPGMAGLPVEPDMPQPMQKPRPTQIGFKGAAPISVGDQSSQLPGISGTGQYTGGFGAVPGEPIQMDGGKQPFTPPMYSSPGGPSMPGLPGAPGPSSLVQNYMNPYIEAALNPQMRELTRQADIARGEDAARLAKAGAFGGSRQAIMEAEGRRNLLNKQSDVLGQGYATAYDKAMAQFNEEQKRKIQEAQFGSELGLKGAQTGLQAADILGNIGTKEGQFALEGIKSLADLGGQQRAIEQAGIDADKAQFEEARLNPYKMLQFQQSLLSGLPLAAQSIYQPGQSNLQQFASGTTTVAQLLKSLGLLK